MASTASGSHAIATAMMARRTTVRSSGPTAPNGGGNRAYGPASNGIAGVATVRSSASAASPRAGGAGFGAAAKGIALVMGFPTGRGYGRGPWFTMRLLVKAAQYTLDQWAPYRTPGQPTWHVRRIR